ncbi:unnamed protein product, partial [Mesorhabditis belari]|uniref:Uncharacterized protein n=1 Tax=Mesorhabditis belari TaxID=2138241 RepID=A0AAF3FAF8_9BILA
MRLLFFSVIVLVQITAIEISEEYDRCKKEGFGNETLVCDLDNRLSERTTAKLNFLLNDLRDSVPCKCETGCKREDGRGGYFGLLMITDSKM